MWRFFQLVSQPLVLPFLLSLSCGNLKCKLGKFPRAASHLANNNSAHRLKTIYAADCMNWSFVSNVLVNSVHSAPSRSIKGPLMVGY
jgi:hypothetical protein